MSDQKKNPSISADDLTRTQKPKPKPDLSPVGIDPADLEAKRKAFSLTNEQMQEMAASVFQCATCRREYLGSECHVHVLGAREGDMVSLERSWVLQCPDADCRGALVRVRGASATPTGRRFWGRLLGRVQ